MSDPREALEDVIRTALTGRDRARRNLRPDVRKRADEVFVAAVLKQADQAVTITANAKVDQACEALNRLRDGIEDALRDELTEARERLRLAREALTGDGYFTPDQVGDDIAPRIIERLAAAQQAPEPAVRPVRPRKAREPSQATPATPKPSLRRTAPPKDAG